MQTIISNQQTTRFSLGEQLPMTSDCIWLIVSGVVKTHTFSSEGTPITLGFWGNKDLVGNPLSKVDPYLNKCLSEVKAIAIPQNQWGSLAREMIYCQQQTQQLIYIVRNTKVAKRLWLLLIWLGNKFGRAVSDGRLIDFQLTHQELANALGTTRITVTKTLNQFEREGSILRPKTRCIILREHKY